MVFLITKCDFCDYSTNVKCNLKRHQNAKHSKEIHAKDDNFKNVQNVSPNVQNVSPNVQNVPPNVQNVPPNQLHCKKCYKTYKTIRHLYNHEKRCNRIDSLTCPKCMISFTNRKHKSRHILSNKCIPRSIIHARIPNKQNVINITDNSRNKTINNYKNNIIINNIGSERIDYISNEDIKQILQSGTNTVPLYIKKKHFDIRFPENKNIKYTNDNKCRVMENNLWKEREISQLSTNLIQDNTEVLLMYCDNNELELLNEINDTDQFEHIRNKLFIIYNKSDNQKYNTVLTKIKELIKSSKENPNIQ